MKESKLAQEQVEELRNIRSNLQRGDSATQAELDRLHDRLSMNHVPTGTQNELLPLVNSEGTVTELRASRWLCHLLGLRHRSVHVLLQWHSPSMGNVFIFQIRSWQKIDSPGCVDISVGGHVTCNVDSPTAIDSAYREMNEELGLDKQNLIDKHLLFKAGYESYDEDDSKDFHNAEWRDVYLGRLDTNEFNRLRFIDNEVVGLYLCPESEAERLLSQTIIPIASALKLSLPYCLQSG